MLYLEYFYKDWYEPLSATGHYGKYPNVCYNLVRYNKIILYFRGCLCCTLQNIRTLCCILQNTKGYFCCHSMFIVTRGVVISFSNFPFQLCPSPCLGLLPAFEACLTSCDIELSMYLSSENLKYL